LILKITLDNFNLRLLYKLGTREVPIFKLQENSKIWLGELDNKLTVEVEWFCSYLLHSPAYDIHDDVYRKHIAQMR